MKVLFVLEHYDPYIGGVEKLFKELGIKLNQQGNTVRVVTCLFDKSLPKHEIRNGVEIIRLPISNRYIFTFFGFFFGYRYSKDFDIIHTTSYNAALPGVLMGLFRRKKTIITFHEVWGSLWFKLPYLSIFERIMFWAYEQFVLRLPFDLFIGVSEFTKQALLEYKPANKVMRIYNGLEYGIPRNTKLERGEHFLFFGRLGVSKGIDLLLGAMEILSEKGIAFSLRMVIPKVPKAFFDKITHLISEKKLERQVILLHHLTDEELRKEIAQCRCVIIPSYSEGFCFAAVEVCASGTPVIHSGRGALQEVVSGQSIAMHDLSAEALASAMGKALHEEWHISPLKKFLLSDTVDAYSKLYGSAQS